MNGNDVLFGLGSNGSGQLGNKTLKDCSQPTLALFASSLSKSCPIRIAGGGNHTIILFSDGSIWSTDYKNNGALDIETAEGLDEYIFRRVLAGSSQSTHYKLCSATWTASFLVSKDDQVHVDGTGDKGVLGLGAHTENASPHRVIENFPPSGMEILDIASSMGHTAVVLSDGSVYGWGNGRKGQLGDPGVVWTPRRINGIKFKAVRVVCGREFTLVVGDPDEGRFKVLGVDKHQIQSNSPASLVNWIDVQASWGSIHVLLKDGSLISWGRDDHGQLPPLEIPKLRAIAAGSEHVVAITYAGLIISWGWGEHGNCGEPIDANGDVKGRWNSLALDRFAGKAKNAFVGAGCATSWIWVTN